MPGKGSTKKDGLPQGPQQAQTPCCILFQVLYLLQHRVGIMLYSQDLVHH